MTNRPGISKSNISILMVLAFSFFITNNLWAGTTGKIAGNVFDRSTEEPLLGADVIIKGTGGGPHELRGYLEGVHPNDGPERVHAAIEYTFFTVFSLRGGYKFNYDEQGLTLGGGLSFNIRGTTTGRIDYAFLDYGRLSSVHLLTIGFGLGK